VHEIFVAQIPYITNIILCSSYKTQHKSYKLEMYKAVLFQKLGMTRLGLPVGSISSIH